MKNAYVIKKTSNYENSDKTLITLTLNSAKEWCIATNSPMRFASALIASRYYMQADDLGANGSSPFIVGPRGGTYAIVQKGWRA